MAMRDYEAIFCDETPFVGRRWAYNREDERYEVRLFEGGCRSIPKRCSPMSAPRTEFSCCGSMGRGADSARQWAV